MNSWIRSLGHLIHEIVTAIPHFIQVFVAFIRRVCRREKRFHGKQSYDCLPIPAGVYLRPDACIYSQQYLMSLGMAVTWDNPDVRLTDTLNNPIASYGLQPSTSYTITATIHNKKNDTPVPGMPVVFKLVSFGASGDIIQPIGSAVVDLPVRGTPGEPAHASVTWTTPTSPGHYCITIEAVVPDDATPMDNIGQHNTVVNGVRHGERLELRFPVRNALQIAQRFSARLHSYRLPERHILRRRMGEGAGANRTGQREGDASLLQRVVAANRPDLFPVPADWDAAVTPSDGIIEPGRTVDLTFTATVPASAPAGLQQPFHISISDAEGKAPLGGVTATYTVA